MVVCGGSGVVVVVWRNAVVIVTMVLARVLVLVVAMVIYRGFSLQTYVFVSKRP